MRTRKITKWYIYAQSDVDEEKVLFFILSALNVSNLFHITPATSCMKMSEMEGKHRFDDVI